MEVLVFLLVLVFVAASDRRRPKNKGHSPRINRSHRTRADRSPLPRRAPPLQTKPRATGAVARRFTGKAYIIDGDSLRIKGEEIRLFGVDAPEFDHPYGKQAKWALHALTKGQTVQVNVVALDHYGRTVAKCFLPDGRDLSAEMVKQGLALDWAKFSGGLYRAHEPPRIRKSLWLADARQKGRMHVWAAYEARQKAGG